jgi:NADPH:quinone reductase-like Zn-dependent oxidoreductase
MNAIRISETGGPEVMDLEEIEIPTTKEGEVLVKVSHSTLVSSRRAGVST